VATGLGLLALGAIGSSFVFKAPAPVVQAANPAPAASSAPSASAAPKLASLSRQDPDLAAGFEPALAHGDLVRARRLVAKAGNDALGQLRRGRLFDATGKDREALQELQQAVALDAPTGIRSMANAALAIAKLRQGDHAGARAAVQAALASGDPSGEARRAQAELDRREGKQAPAGDGPHGQIRQALATPGAIGAERALAAYRAARGAGWNDLELHLLGCEAAARRQAWRTLEEAVAAASRSGVKDARLWYWQGRAADARNDSELADAMYLQARQRDPQLDPAAVAYLKARR
jgi:hypothetical protein